ncbi:SUKH-3 domain-containing protein [Flavobacterium sp. MMLR14_040]|uniref:SUKH-3 domain-containing protein n=1 Tax=Flavobacterium sp. MMLR14_040 TaxID=3093843 RepID=UPI00299048B5|nr:SUKH-3 domain-containing protein [Flavobacterium sp. MMLR14_040]MDW8851245.1 SUKH-3 domain-containing protein [Flavobacterium sp. MMLR14_040]
MMNEEEDFTTVLINAGWYKGRTIKSKIENTILYEILPKKIQNFLCEFGELKIHAENRIATMIIDTGYLDNKKAFDYQFSNIYKLDDEIDLSDDRSQNYYYSTLIGTQLYPVAKLIEQSEVLMDENGNFYIIDSLPQLIWISNETFNALIKIIFGSGDVAIFNEHSMEWMTPLGKELNQNLPINPILKNNPW